MKTPINISGAKLIPVYLNSKFRQHIEDKNSLLMLMHGLIILEYKNGDRWQDLHPLITKFLIKQDVLDESNNAAN